MCNESSLRDPFEDQSDLFEGQTSSEECVYEKVILEAHSLLLDRKATPYEKSKTAASLRDTFPQCFDDSSSERRSQSSPPL